MKYLSIPRYRVRPSPGRFLFDKLLILFGLGILLYIGIYVNYFLLSTSIPAVTNWLFIIGIILLCVLELILSYVRYSNYVYEFYDEKITMNYSDTREIPYSSISHVKYDTNIFDRWFKTGTIVVSVSGGKDFKLKYLNSPNQAYMLLQRHVK